LLDSNETGSELVANKLSIFTKKTILLRGHIMSRLSIISEFGEFLRVRKKWWLVPIVIFLILLGVLIVLTEGSTLAPFIYTLF